MEKELDSKTEKFKEIITHFKLPKGYSISFPTIHEFSDGHKTYSNQKSPLIYINYNGDRLGLSKVSFIDGNLNLMYVQGVNKNIKNHPKWFEYLLDPIIFTGIAVYGSSKNLDKHFEFNEYINSKNNYLNYKRLYEYEKNFFLLNKKDYSKDKLSYNKKELDILYQRVKDLHHKYVLHAKIKDRYLIKNGKGLNLNKKRIKEMQEVYKNYQKTKNKGTIIKKKDKKPFLDPLKD